MKILLGFAWGVITPFLLLLASLPLFAGTNYVREQVSLAWEPSPSPDVVNHKVYWGTNSRTYTESVLLGNVTNYTVTLPYNSQGTFYFAATAINAGGMESEWSNEVAYTLSSTNAPAPPQWKDTILVSLQRSTNLQGSWFTVTNFAAVYTGTTNNIRFYRSVLNIATNSP